LIGLGTPSTSASAPTAFVRHNAGQKFVEWVAKRERISEFWRHSSACSGSITESDRVVLFRPSASRMDQSGSAVAQAVRYIGAPLSSIWIAHDEPAVTGVVDVRPGGRGGRGRGSGRSDAEGVRELHEGVRSVVSALGSDEFKRVAIGVGRPGHRPSNVDKWAQGRIRDVV